jgi:serine/threonine-protein kinase
MIGQTVLHYRIVEKLAEGGMGVVYKAEDTRLKRVVALKFLPPELTRDQKAKERFVHEAQAASALDHPNICTIHQIDETPEGQMFICMACYEGESLNERIARGPLEIVDAVDIATDVGKGLAKAHEKGITHRDIKPANIVITGDDQLKIIDFGLAILAGRTGVTKTGMTVGTSTYMSPEQAQGGVVDHRTDIWSMGVVLYQMLTGEAPFRGDHDAAVLYSVVHEDPRPIGDFRDDVPPDLWRIIRRALAKNPGDRYQTVNDMLADLEAARIGYAGARAVFKTAPQVLPRPGKRSLLIGIPVVLALIVVAALWLKRTPSDEEAAVAGERPATTTVQPRNSIAVLPLVNLAPGDENDFFVDGMTEELITQLAQIKALKVISRTSVMRFKDTEEPVTEIARQLNVSTIVEGSVMWAGEQVRISVQMIDGVDEGHLWANSYRSDLGDVLGLQRRVAKDVADQARVELTAQEETRLSSSPVVNREAYELYLQGRFHWNKRTSVGLERAMEYYRRAIEVDPEYGLAYAGLAESQILKATWTEGSRPEKVYPAAREMALRALEIEPDMAAAHTVLGAVAHEYSWDWVEAEGQLLRAIELNPNYATAHQWYGELLATLGRTNESVREARAAQELDPFSLIINAWVGQALVLDGQTEAALAEMDKVEEMNPSFPPLWLIRHLCYSWIGDWERCAESWIRYCETAAISQRQKEDARALRAAYEGGGLPEFYRTAIGHLKRLYNESYASPQYIAGFHAAAGEPDSAMVWLERGYREHGSQMYTVARSGLFDILRDDPRFVDLMKRMRLTYWK